MDVGTCGKSISIHYKQKVEFPGDIVVCDTEQLKKVLHHAYQKFKILEDTLHLYRTAKGMIGYAQYTSSPKALFKKKNPEDFGINTLDINVFTDTYHAGHVRPTPGAVPSRAGNRRVRITKGDPCQSEEAAPEKRGFLF